MNSLIGIICGLVGFVAFCFFVAMFLFGHFIDEVHVATTSETPIYITADFDYAGGHYKYTALNQTQTSVLGSGGLGHGSALQRFIVPLNDGAGLLVLLNNGFVIHGSETIDLKLASWIWLDNKTSPSKMVVSWGSTPYQTKPELISPDNSVSIHIWNASDSLINGGVKQPYTANAPVAGSIAGLSKPTEGLFFGGLNAALLQGDEGNDLRNLPGWQSQPDGCSVHFGDDKNKLILRQVSNRFPITHYAVLDHDKSWHIEATDGSHQGHLYSTGRTIVGPILDQTLYQPLISYVGEISHSGTTCHISGLWQQHNGDIAIASPRGDWIITLTPSPFWILGPVSNKF